MQKNVLTIEPECKANFKGTLRSLYLSINN